MAKDVYVSRRYPMGIRRMSRVLAGLADADDRTTLRVAIALDRGDPDPLAGVAAQSRARIAPVIATARAALAAAPMPDDAQPLP